MYTSGLFLLRLVIITPFASRTLDGILFARFPVFATLIAMCFLLLHEIFSPKRSTSYNTSPAANPILCGYSGLGHAYISAFLILMAMYLSPLLLRNSSQK